MLFSAQEDCTMLTAGEPQRKPKHMVDAAAGLSMPRRSSRPAKGHFPSGLCCTGLIQPLYLCHTGGQFIKINKEGANQHTRGMKSLPTSLNFHWMDSQRQNIPPPSARRCREVAASDLLAAGRNLASCRHTKLRSPSALKVTTVIGSTGQPREGAA